MNSALFRFPLLVTLALSLLAHEGFAGSDDACAREPEPGHRHISPLWALFPGTQISPGQTPELAKAARVLLERRLSFGGGQTGCALAFALLRHVVHDDVETELLAVIERAHRTPFRISMASSIEPTR